MSHYKLSRALCFWAFIWAVISMAVGEDSHFWGAVMLSAAVGFALFDWQMFWEIKKGEEK